MTNRHQLAHGSRQGFDTEHTPVHHLATTKQRQRTNSVEADRPVIPNNNAYQRREQSMQHGQLPVTGPPRTPAHRQAPPSCSCSSQAPRCTNATLTHNEVVGSTRWPTRNQRSDTKVPRRFGEMSHQIRRVPCCIKSSCRREPSVGELHHPNHLHEHNHLAYDANSADG